MKMFIVMLVAVVTSVAQADPVVRLPRVTEAFQAAIDHYKVVSESQTYNDGHFVVVESSWSNSYSAAQGSADYFVVKSSGTNGGRILRMTRDRYTINDTPSFTDVLTGESVKPTLSLQQNGKAPYGSVVMPEDFVQGVFYYGSFKIGNDEYNILMAYRSTQRYPTVSLTWGDGSTIFDYGTILDTFEGVSTEAPVTKTALEMVEARGVEGLADGLYLSVTSPKEFGHIRVEKTTDFRTWSEVTISPLVIYGDMIAYQIPKEGAAFFRAIEK